MAKRSGNGKPADPQIRLLTSIDEKLTQLVDAVVDLKKGQEHLTKRIDNMLDFLGQHWSEHAQRLAAVEQRLTKAGL